MMRSKRAGATRHLRLQTSLAIVAVGVAVALPVLLLSVGGGVAQHELATLTDSGYQIVLSAPGAHGIRGAHALTDRIGVLGSVRATSPLLTVTVTAFSSAGAQFPLLAEGILPGPFLSTASPEERALLPASLPLGDPTDAQGFANGSYSGRAGGPILVSGPLSSAQQVRVGDTISLSASGNRSQAATFNVTAVFGLPPTILGPSAAFVAFLPLSQLQRLTGEATGSTGVIDGADSIQVGLVSAAATDPHRVDSIASQIRSLTPYYSVSTLDDQIAQLQSTDSVLNGFYLALSSFSLAVGLLFLTLLLVRRVEALRASVALRRALGVPARDLAAWMARTALALAAAGIALGVVGGIVAVAVLDQWGSTSVATVARLAVFDPVQLGELAAAVLGLAAILSLVATRAALRLSIPEALR